MCILTSTKNFLSAEVYFGFHNALSVLYFPPESIAPQSYIASRKQHKQDLDLCITTAFALDTLAIVVSLLS